MRSFVGNCPILLVYPIWAVVSLKLPAISLPIFSVRENLNCLQKVRDVPVICGILGLLQYPSFAQANTVSESHYARTMSSRVRFRYRTLLKYLQIVRESCDCPRYTGTVTVSEFCKSNHSFRFLTIIISLCPQSLCGHRKISS